MSALMLQGLPHWIVDNMDIWITIFIGAVAGILAQLIVPGRGFSFLFSIVLGIAGGWLGGKVFKNMLNVTGSPMMNAILCATAGAIILYIIFSIIMRAVPMKVDRLERKSRKESEW